MPRLLKLPNGLSLVVAPVKGTKAATFLAMVPIGSRYELPKISGASHFVEHLMFKGTKKRPTSLDISRELDAAGAQFNAFTSKDYTGYYVKIDGAKSGLALDILSDMLFHSKFEAAEIKREKGVILEEIKMYEDNPATAVNSLFEKLFFGRHPLGRDIAGTKKSVAGVSRRELLDYYQRAYRPANMVLVAAGNIKSDLLGKVKKYFGRTRAEAGGKKISKKDFVQFSKKQIPIARLSVEKRKVDQANVIIGFPGLSHNDRRRYALAVLLNILGGGMSSRLFVEVREKRGLAYRVRANADAFRDCGLVCVEAGLDARRLGEAMATIKNEFKKISQKPVSAKELADAKTNLAGHLALAMEDSSVQANWFASKFWFEGNLENYETEIRRLKKVTVGQVLKLAREIFKEKAMRLAVIGPLNKKAVIKAAS